MKHPFELTTCTADITTPKVMWNSTTITSNDRYMYADAWSFDPSTPLNCPKYMRIKVEVVPQEFIDANNLASNVKNL